MSVFNRKLFTHTPYHHYGTGISSGVVERQGFAVGGRVKLNKGGDLISQTTKEGQIINAKEAIFDGNNSVVIKNQGDIASLSLAAKEYYRDLNRMLDEKGLKDSFLSLPKEQQQIIAQELNDRILSNLAQKYSIPIETVYEQFGGERTINNALKGIKSSIQNKTIGLDTERVDKKINKDIDKINKQFGEENLMASVPSQDTKELGTDDGVDDGGSADMDPNKQGLASIADDSLMGMDQTTDEFRKEYMDNLLASQDELGLSDTRKRQALTNTLLGIGAADPVQKGQSLTQMISKSFQDPMKGLYDAENLRAEDVYKRYADRTDAAYDTTDEGERVKFAKYLAENTDMSTEEVGEALLGISGSNANLALTLAEDENVGNNINRLQSENPGLSYEKAFEVSTGYTLQGERVVSDTNLTDDTLTANTLNPDYVGDLRESSASGGRIGMQYGGNANMDMAVQSEQPLINQGTPAIEPMSFEELREKLPDYISDDVVQLLADDPKALMELAQAQTERDLNMFEKKYNVQVTMPLAEDEATTDGML